MKCIECFEHMHMRILQAWPGVDIAIEEAALGVSPCGLNQIRQTVRFLEEVSALERVTRI